MSFLKFWGKKGKKEDEKDEATMDPEAEKRRLRHSLSISRSGRFKQKKRERGQILDKPELFGGHDDNAQPNENQPMASNSSHHSSSHRPSHQRSPNMSCRDMNTSMPTGNRQMRLGQSVAT